MSLTVGTRLGVYEIVSPIGAGGMGEVYKARDTRLNRDVAIKVLPEIFAADADRLARFTREAQVLASLNHPNIAAIYGIEANALVMELVDGQDLSALIDGARRSALGARSSVSQAASTPSAQSQEPSQGLPLLEVLPIARQIAEALEAAHEAGIIHRDLKPANVKVRADGTVKVLDFGLAKAADPAGGSAPSAMNSPTITAHATQLGMILGTAAYMSPEQAKGRAVDKRADIWAFGVVLYEMLTGTRCFKGDDVSDTLASVLKDTPAFDALPASTPPRLRRLIERCLERDLRTRLRDIGEARVVLDELARGGTVADAPPQVIASRSRPPMWTIGATAAAMLAIGLVAGRWIWSDRSPAASSTPLVRLATLAPADVTDVPRLAMAADGSFVVFVGISGNTQQLYVRRLDELTARSIDRTEGADRPFLSPDGKWIGFTRANHLEKIAVSGGEAVRLADVSTSNPGSAWGPDNSILVTTSWYSGLSAVSANGGELRQVTTVDTAHGEKGHWFPQFLPDSRHALFTVWRAGGGLIDSQIAVLDLSSGKYTILMSGAHASYVAPGFLVFYRAGAYQAIRFDLQSLLTSGDPVTVLTDDRGVTPDGSNPSFSVAVNGTVAYVPGQYYSSSTLTWVAEGGRLEPLPFAARSYVSAAVSPHGRLIATGVLEGGQYVTRVLDLDRHTDDAFELPGSNWNPVWNPDGRRIAMRSMLKGDFDIYAKDISSSAPALKLLANPGDETPMAWLSEKTLVISQAGADGLYRTKLLDLDAPDRPTLLSDHNPDSLSVSPDGRWLAIADVHTGRGEIYLRRASGDGIPERITSNGGSTPVFLRNGRDLLYLRGQDIIAVSWREDSGRVSVERERVWAHVTASLFQRTQYGEGGIYDSGADGRVLVGIPKDSTLTPQVRIILNWQDELARKLAR